MNKWFKMNKQALTRAIKWQSPLTASLFPGV